MTRQPNQPWCADRTTPVILITGNPDVVEIKKDPGKLTVLMLYITILFAFRVPWGWTYTAGTVAD